MGKRYGHATSRNTAQGYVYKKMDMISEPIALIYYHKFIKWSTVINYI